MMRERLINYVALLFAGTTDTEDIQQEILQNTLDRFDDLVAQGKSPEAAYRLAISGIGDINEILGTPEPEPQMKTPQVPTTPFWKKLLRAAAIFIYIISPIPLFVLSELGMETIGLCGTLSIVAVATAMMVIASGKSSPAPKKEEIPEPHGDLRKAINAVLGIGSLCIYLILSFTTRAWWITWLVFPMMGAVRGLIRACLDLKEATKHES